MPIKHIQFDDISSIDFYVDTALDGVTLRFVDNFTGYNLVNISIDAALTIANFIKEELDPVDVPRRSSGTHQLLLDCLTLANRHDDDLADRIRNLIDIIKE